MRVYDQIAAVVKSGGKTRRAAKMQSIKVWHPDVMEFIECKWKEEQKAHALIREGYESNFNGEAYSSVMFQNANLSVRVTDEFMEAVKQNKPWKTRWVSDRSDGEAPTYEAKAILEDGLGTQVAPGWDEVNAFRQKLAGSGRSFGDSVDLLREDRER